MLYSKIYEAIGKTPLFKIESENMADIYLKMEFLNPGGSIKDRPALYMINTAEEMGLLEKGGTIIEPTSGNTGIALAMIGAAKGYKVIIVMPDSMSIERRKLMEAYGAELILTEGKQGMQGAVNLASKLANTKKYFMPDQFANNSNVKAHYETTSVEILDELGQVDGFLAGVGTGGTLTGVGKRLKEVNEKTEIIAVEPASSPLLSKGEAGPHKIQGIGANFVPHILDRSIIDEVYTITDEEAYEGARFLSSHYGLLVGISSGANYMAAKKLAKKLGKGKKLVTVLPDSGERYLSTSLFDGE